MTSRGELPRSTRFDARRLVASGAAGDVYEAADRARNGARVALKALRYADAESLFSFKREFRALAALRHPNLVGLEDLVCEDGCWFLSMEFVDGEDILAYLRPGGGEADLARVRHVVPQLVSGLSALHSFGLVHRDVKPSNVLVAADGRVVVLDFGLVADARAPGDGDEGLILGTPKTMAPEQIVGDQVGPPADWYAVGVVLFLALTGEYPFEGSAQEVMQAKRVRDADPPSSRRKGIPADLDALCAVLLRRQPIERPTAEEILARLAIPPEAAPSRRAFPSIAPFVGRAPELERLRAAFEQTRERPVLAVIEGDSGLGKTCLLEHFLGEITRKEPDALILRSRCYERELVPFKAFDGAIDGLSVYLGGRGSREVARLVPPREARILVRAFPVLGRTVPLPGDALSENALEPAEFRRRAFAALREAFRRIADERPVVVAIDDLQWTDDDSRALLQSLRSGNDAPRILFVAAARQLDAEMLDGAVHVVLAGLADDEATTLLKNVGPSLDEASIGALLTEGAGHPLFLQELARAPAVATPGKARVLDEALSARAFAQEPDARRLLEVVAVAGAPMPLEAARRAADLSNEAVARARLDLAGARLLRPSARGSDALECYHDRVRESVVARLSVETVTAHHAQIAAALEALRIDDPARMHRHFEAAGNVERAAHWAEEAATRAESTFAFQQAAAFYQSALRLGRRDSEQTHALQRRLAAVLANAGRGAQAAEVYLALVPSIRDEADALEVRRRAADGLLLSGHVEEGVAALRGVLEAVGMSYPRQLWLALLLFLIARARLWGRALVGRGILSKRVASAVTEAQLVRLDACFAVARLFAMVDTIRGAYFQALAIHYALRVGEPARLANALTLEACYEAVIGPSARPRVDRILTVARAMAAESHDRKAIALAEAGDAFVTFLEGSYYESVEKIAKATRFMRECAGAAWELRTLEEFGVWAQAFVGGPNDLRAVLEPQLREAEERGDMFLGANMRAGITAFAWLGQDDPARARALALEGGSLWKEEGYQIQHHRSVVGLTLIDLYEGKGNLAFLRLSAIKRQFLGALFLRVRVLHVEAHLMWGRAALANAVTLEPSARGPFLRIARRVVRQLREDEFSLARAGVPLLDAGVLDLSGDRSGADDALRLAVMRADAVHYGSYAAAARWLLAGRLAGDEARTYGDAAARWIAEKEVRNMGSFARTLAPGVSRPVTRGSGA